MNEDELKSLRKDMRKKKRIATEHASVLHDLVEDRLFDSFADLPEAAQACYEACVAWHEANTALDAAEAEVGVTS